MKRNDPYLTEHGRIVGFFGFRIPQFTDLNFKRRHFFLLDKNYTALKTTTGQVKQNASYLFKKKSQRSFIYNYSITFYVVCDLLSVIFNT